MDQNKVIAIQEMIYEIRGHKIMIDRDLAELYGVELKVMNQSVKRNLDRFPLDFMFQLTQDEWNILRSQIVTANENTSKIRYLPYAFTEHGILMLSSVLNSDRAININIQVMRIFVQMRHYAISQTPVNDQITELRKLLMLYIEKNDKRVNEIIIVLNNLIEQPPASQPKRIGFKANEEE